MVKHGHKISEGGKFGWKKRRFELNKLAQRMNAIMERNRDRLCKNYSGPG